MKREGRDWRIMTPTITRLTTVMVCLPLLASPLSAEAAAAGAAPRVGVLLAGSRADAIQREVEELRQGLREIGLWKARPSRSSTDGQRGR